MTIIRTTTNTGLRLTSQSTMTVQEYIDAVMDSPAHRKSFEKNGTVRGGRNPHGASYVHNGTIYWISNA